MARLLVAPRCFRLSGLIRRIAKDMATALGSSSAPERDAFISHASADLDAASRIEKTLEAEKLDVWLDHSEIQLGVLLAGELQQAISACRVLILLWSEPAAASRWVNTEWLAAHHLDRFILPCVLDDTPLPQCFEHSVHLGLRREQRSLGWRRP